jgi:hypothetical protein
MRAPLGQRPAAQQEQQRSRRPQRSLEIGFSCLLLDVSNWLEYVRYRRDLNAAIAEIVGRAEEKLN